MRTALKISELILTYVLLHSFVACYSQEKFPAPDLKNKIQVLNMGTFHMGFSSDQHTTDYDEHDKKNILENKEIARKIAEFKPTVIIVEIEPKNNFALQKSYGSYCKNPKMEFKNPSEIELLAFEVGRLSNAKQIYGIDEQLEYDYPKIQGLAEKIEAKTYLNFMENLKFKDEKSTGTLEKLIATNQPEYLDFLINVNADMMSYVSTENNFEGADVASEFYRRNLRMFSNLNRIPLKENDRVFILMGASHTAFFKEFMKRSPRYKLVNLFDYLK